MTEPGDEAAHWRRAAIQTESEIHDILAKALGYPEYQPGEPGYAEHKVEYVTGDHVAASLALEAARKLEHYRRLVAELEQQREDGE